MRSPLKALLITGSLAAILGATLPAALLTTAAPAAAPNAMKSRKRMAPSRRASGEPNANSHTTLKIR